MKATINTLPECPWCVKAKKLLDLKGIEYVEVDGKANEWPTVPYITIDEQHVGGFVELAAWCRKH